MKKVSRRRLLMMVEAPFEGVSWEDTYLFEVVRLSVHHGAWTENQLLQFFSHEVHYCTWTYGLCSKKWHRDDQKIRQNQQNLGHIQTAISQAKTGSSLSSNNAKCIIHSIFIYYIIFWFCSDALRTEYITINDYRIKKLITDASLWANLPEF